jgi:two-component system KDP operon response regulator KdpE
MTRVLIIDDDPSLLRALRLALARFDYEVLTAATGEKGIQETASSNPDIVVLDLGLPDLDGVTVCRRIRTWSNVPIIILSAADAEARKVAALNEGADDYVTKPFGMAELEARIRTELRHHRGSADESPAPIVFGPLRLDLVQQQALLNDEPLRLTPKEFAVLAYLARHVGKVCTRQVILESVWGGSYAKETHYLHAYIHRLREKIGATAVKIETVPGIGYVLSLEDSGEGSKDGQTNDRS